MFAHCKVELEDNSDFPAKKQIRFKCNKDYII